MTMRCTRYSAATNKKRSSGRKRLTATIPAPNKRLKKSHDFPAPSDDESYQPVKKTATKKKKPAPVKKETTSAPARSSKRVSGTEDSVVPNKCDAVFGRGRKKTHVRDGSLYRTLVEKHWRPYAKLNTTNFEKRRNYVKSKIVDVVVKQGGRFIMRNGLELSLLSPTTNGDLRLIYKKIQRALFNEKKRQESYGVDVPLPESNHDDEGEEEDDVVSEDFVGLTQEWKCMAEPLPASASDLMMLAEEEADPEDEGNDDETYVDDEDLSVSENDMEEEQDEPESIVPKVVCKDVDFTPNNLPASRSGELMICNQRVKEEPGFDAASGINEKEADLLSISDDGTLVSSDSDLEPDMVSEPEATSTQEDASPKKACRRRSSLDTLALLACELLVQDNDLKKEESQSLPVVSVPAPVVVPAPIPAAPVLALAPMAMPLKKRMYRRESYNSSCVALQEMAAQMKLGRVDAGSLSFNQCLLDQLRLQPRVGLLEAYFEEFGRPFAF